MHDAINCKYFACEWPAHIFNPFSLVVCWSSCLVVSGYHNLQESNLSEDREANTARLRLQLRSEGVISHEVEMYYADPDTPGFATESDATWLKALQGYLSIRCCY